MLSSEIVARSNAFANNPFVHDRMRGVNDEWVDATCSLCRYAFKGDDETVVVDTERNVKGVKCTVRVHVHKDCPPAHTPERCPAYERTCAISACASRPEKLIKVTQNDRIYHLCDDCHKVFNEDMDLSKWGKPQPHITECLDCRNVLNQNASKTIEKLIAGGRNPPGVSRRCTKCATRFLRRTNKPFKGVAPCQKCFCPVASDTPCVTCDGLDRCTF